MWFSVACGEVPAGLWVCVGGGAPCGATFHLGRRDVCTLLFSWLCRVPAGQRGHSANGG